jgi:hypothetical protein
MNPTRRVCARLTRHGLVVNEAVDKVGYNKAAVHREK